MMNIIKNLRNRIIKPIIEACTGENLITGEDLIVEGKDYNEAIR